MLTMFKSAILGCYFPRRSLQQNCGYLRQFHTCAISPRVIVIRSCEWWWSDLAVSKECESTGWWEYFISTYIGPVEIARYGTSCIITDNNLSSHLQTIVMTKNAPLIITNSVDFMTKYADCLWLIIRNTDGKLFCCYYWRSFGGHFNTQT